MATTKTIKPIGSGDFSTFATWEDWASTQPANEKLVAEVDSSGVVGKLELTDWTDEIPASGVKAEIKTIDDGGVTPRTTSIDLNSVTHIKINGLKFGPEHKTKV